MQIILLLILNGDIMNEFLQMLQRGFLVGAVIAACLSGFVAFFYIIYLIIKVFKNDKESKCKIHKFWKVSKRGRAAYLILCLEEALKFYNQDFSKWKWILEELWKITTIPESEEENWIFRIYDILPNMVFGYNTWEELKTDEKENLITLNYIYSEEQFYNLKNLYENAGYRMIVFNSLLEYICYVISDDYGQYKTPHTPDALEFIDKAEEILHNYKIPLPNDEKTLHFIFSQKDKYIGKAFNGLSLSILSK